MDYIDAHVHIGNDQGGFSADHDEVTALMEEYGIDRSVVFCFNEPRGIEWGNSMIRDIVCDDDRLAGLFRIDPAVHDPDDLRRADDFAGFKMHPRSQDFAMQHVHEHLTVAGDLDKPVLIHTGGWSDRAHPKEIIEAAEIHRETAIIAAHNMKGYYYQAGPDMIDLVKDLNNLYVETSLHCTPSGVEKLVEDLGAQRVLFGSDYPYGHPVPMMKNIELADITEKQAQAVAADNAQGLFW